MISLMFKHCTKGARSVILALAYCGLSVSSSLAQDQPKPVEPEISDTLTTPGENPAGNQTDDISDADLAYGAYQRGYYLTAFRLALPRANLGDPAAQTLIAELYERGLGVAKDQKEATQWFKIAANSGNREAQFSYALKLFQGKFVTRDEKLATQLLQKAADAGHPQALYNYSQQLIEQKPGNRGFVEALPYLKRAANLGVPDAYFALSKIYQSGRGGVAPDSTAARNWLIRAARGGIDTAQLELGIQLANGTGGERDERSGFAWLQKAALSGNVIAQNRLARMYADGIGTPANAVEAGKWYILSRRAGLTDIWLSDFIKTLGEKDRSLALEAANRWRPL